MYSTIRILKLNSGDISSRFQLLLCSIFRKSMLLGSLPPLSVRKFLLINPHFFRKVLTVLISGSLLVNRNIQLLSGTDVRDQQVSVASIGGKNTDIMKKSSWCCINKLIVMIPVLFSFLKQSQISFGTCHLVLSLQEKNNIFCFLLTLA